MRLCLLFISQYILGILGDGGYWAVQSGVEMAAIEGLLFCGEDGSELFKRQDWDFQGAALADGVLWMCEIRERSSVLVGVLEKLLYFWIPVFCWARIGGSACHNVELLPELDIDVMSSICAS